MKSYKVVLMVICAILILAALGCKKDGETTNRTAKQSGVEEVLLAGMKEAEDINASSKEGYEMGDQIRQSGVNDNAPEPVVQADEKTVLSSTEGIDVDLTSLSSTMVYSEVYNMMYEPDNYIGKTIKMNGLFTAYHDESTGNDYYACIIQDATACCAQGMEFILTDDYSYPDDYPEESEQITVVGVFDTYMEGDYMYCTLRDANFV